MKELPNVNIDYGSIEEMIFAPIKSRLLLTAIDLRLFNHLSRPMSAGAIAGVLKTHQKNTELFLDALSACHLVVKSNGMYRNTDASAAFLAGNLPTYLGNWFKLGARAFEPVLDNLPELIKNGPPPKIQEEDMNSEEMCEHYTESHAATELAGIARRVAHCVAELPEFSGFNKMLDLGGGPGLISVAIMAIHPHMKGIVFDRKNIVAIAEKYIREYGMEDRISVKSGDYYHDPIGDGYDLILASDTLYHKPQETKTIVRKLFDALRPSGVLFGIHGVLTHERTRPESMTIGILPESLMGQGELPDSGFLADAMLQVGFKSVRSSELKIPGNTMELDIGRKA